MSAYRCIYPRCPESCCQCNYAVPESAPEARAEAQSSDAATRDHSNETVSSRVSGDKSGR